VGASRTHTKDTALQMPVYFRSGQAVRYQSVTRPQGITREFARKFLPQLFQLTLEATAEAPESGEPLATA